MNKFLKYAGISIIALIVLEVLFSGDPQPKKTFDQMTGQERRDHIEKFLDSNDGLTFIYNLKAALKKDFNYPETVKFGSCHLPNAQVTNPIEGKCFLVCEAIANNAFNVPVNHAIHIKFTYTDELSIEDIQITQQ